MRRVPSALLALSALVFLAFPLSVPLLSQAPGGPSLGISALAPASTGGIAAVDRALAKLTQHRRLLVVGAHPDDEDTTVLTWNAVGEGGESAYFSLSRGEGGQNLIGPELGVELGLIRSRELLAAREIDGGRQFFSRAYDFGYTRSVDEAFELWPREALLEDAVRIVRRFRPQVVVAVFPPDERAGHGQHQASGVIASEAFAHAGDGEGFAALTGSTPWAPTAFFRAIWWDRDAVGLETGLGRLDPLTGKSLYQLATESRSQHRSQDMGRVQPLGDFQGRYGWEAGPGGAGSDDLFAGIDTRLEAIADLLPAGASRETARRELAAARESAEALRRGLSPVGLAEAARALGEILDRLDAARAAAERVGGDDSRAARELIDEKIAVASQGLLAAAGVAVDAWTERASAAGERGNEVVPGEPFAIEAVVWHAGSVAAAGASAGPPAGGSALAVEPLGLEVAGTVLWQTEPTLDDQGAPVAPVEAALGAGELATWGLSLTAPPDTPATAPYFLAAPLAGALYDWRGAPPGVRGEAFGPPPLTARFRLRIAGRELAVEREVVQRVSDQAVGEVRRPLRVVPALEIALDPGLVVWPTGDRAPRTVRVSLDSHAGRPLAGEVRIETPAGWPPIAALPLEIADPGGAVTLEARVTPPADLVPGRYHLAAIAVLADGSRYAAAFPVVEYPHIRPTPEPRRATVEIAAADIEVPALARVGYVLGASDRVAEDLAAIGVPIELLTGHDLLSADLSGFDAVVVGSRAYETDPALGRANARLLAYARAGGLVIVQYQQYAFVDGGFAPYPLAIARPHDRVTEEDAPVTVLAPEHPAFTTPNRIGPADWEGWVQERGLYFASTWDPAYTPLLSFPASAGYPPGELRGGLLVAPAGDGTWVYTGLAFFRQLPAGVTGAYRLLANLLALE